MSPGRPILPPDLAGPRSAPDLEEGWPASYLLERMAWLVRLRWLAVGGVLVALGATMASGLVQPGAPLLAGVAGLVALNVHAWRSLRASHREPDPARLQSSVFRHLVGDTAVLTLLLQYSGGMENPFVMFYSFLMAIGAILLPAHLSTRLAVFAALLHGGGVLGEYAGVLEASSLGELVPGERARLPRSSHPAGALGHLIAFCLMLFGIVYFVRSVVARYRHADALRMERERVALSRERLARVGELAAGVSHAVRNPLHGLIGALDLLAARSKGEPSEREMLDHMGEACHRIEAATQRLLLLARDAPLEKTRQPLDKLVEEAVRTSSPAARGSAARLHLSLEGGGTVEADAVRLVEALVNVIDNAVDACRGGGEVRVRTLARGTLGGGQCIEVSDTGEGIPPGDLRRVFDPFFTTKPVGQGTGLGLAIVRQVVEGHGGEVWIESEPGRGTTVRIHLPDASGAPPGESER